MEESSNGECIEPVRRHYEDLFRRYNVTMVFSGHTHVYEHFWVPDDGHETRVRPSPTTFPHDGTAIHYLISGGGGGPRPANCNSLWNERDQQPSYNYSQARDCAYFFVQVHVRRERLDVEVIGVEGNANDHSTTSLDSFTIQ